jgi:hypothetical protein
MTEVFGFDGNHCIGDWKEEYNHDRLPQSSLGYRTPRAYAAIRTR